MREIITLVVTSLDGYMDGPSGDGDLDWCLPFVDESLPDTEAMLGGEIDTILLGRVTYEGFSQYWPNQEGDFADLMNKPPKLVFASPGALAEVPWGEPDNATLIDHDIEATLRELKAQDGKDMVILASGGLVSSLLGLGLVDELRLVVCPVALGTGKPYLRGLRQPIGLGLKDVKRYSNGAVLLTYRISGGD